MTTCQDMQKSPYKLQTIWQRSYTRLVHISPPVLCLRGVVRHQRSVDNVNFLLVIDYPREKHDGHDMICPLLLPAREEFRQEEIDCFFEEQLREVAVSAC